MDRYFYTVELDSDGTKIIHMNGNVYLNDIDETDTNYRCAEWTGLYISVADMQSMIDNDELFDFINEKVNYLEDLTKEEADKLCDEFFAGQPGHYFDIKNVTEDAPCGEYWFEGGL